MMWFRRFKRQIVVPRVSVIDEPVRDDPGPTVNIYDENFEITHRCPECDGPVSHIGTCQTYGWDDEGNRGRSCVGCWSAILLYCVREYDQDEDHIGCGWEYTWGLNPRNPRSKDNNLCRPSWIPVGARWDGGWPAA